VGLMSRARFLFYIAVGAAVAFLMQAISGLVLWVALPCGGRRGGEVGDTFLWSRQAWLDIHDWTGVLLLAIIAVHIYMHWGWLCRQVRSLVKSK